MNNKANGHPLKIKPDKLNKIIDDYFLSCEEKCIVPLYPELLIKCDLLRETWDEYREWYEEIDEKRYEEDKAYRQRIEDRKQLRSAIKKAELRLEAAMSREASTNSKPTSAIFHLKQKAYGGYTDKQITEIGGTDVPISIILKGSDGKELKADK